MTTNNDKIIVTFLDTFGDELNYSRVKTYEFDADISFKSALTRAKKEYFNRLPRHKLLWGNMSNTSTNCAVRFSGCCIVATIEYVEG